MKKILLKRCRLDDSDAVIEPSLHDSNLVKLDCYDEKNIKLSFKLISNEVKTVYLNGVEGFVCNDLRKGNIVLDLTVSSGQGAPIKILNNLFEAPKHERQKHDLFLEKTQARIFSKELSIVVLNPSYGCKLIALVHSIGYE